MNNPQSLIELLKNSAAYPHAVSDICVKETHISWIILTGSFAYKIKKPVNLGFLDFSTLEKRKHFCEEEIRLNCRLSPDIYLEVVPITSCNGHTFISGSGSVIEYAVKMRQFPENAELDHAILDGRVTSDIIDNLAETIACFHNTLSPAGNDKHWGSAEANHQATLTCINTIEARIGGENVEPRVTSLRAWVEKTYGINRGTMRDRQRSGAVRECHGDLHLGNIALVNGKIRIFDAIEFSESLRWIDVVSEVAFTYMDLFHFQKHFANRFLNHYLQITGDYLGLSLLRYYSTYRAMVRAMVALIRRDQFSVGKKDAPSIHVTTFLSYLSIAEQFTKSPEPMLIICHGLSGSGKTTITQTLLEELPAIRIRSDVERKRLFSLSLYDKSQAGIDQKIYDQGATEKTYDSLLGLANFLLQNKFNVIVDATFLEADYRSRFYELSRKLGVSFVILDFKVPEHILRQRLGIRASNNKEVSEADITVLEHQLATRKSLSWEEKKFAYDIEYGKPFDCKKFIHEFQDASVQLE